MQGFPGWSFGKQNENYWAHAALLLAILRNHLSCLWCSLLCHGGNPFFYLDIVSIKPWFLPMQVEL